MKKSLIALAVAGAAALSLSASAFAGGDVAAYAPEAPASTGGFYVLGGLGWGHQSLSDRTAPAAFTAATVTASTPAGVTSFKAGTKSGFAQTVAAGYKFAGMTGDMSFLNYLGLELGFKNFQNGNWKVMSGSTDTGVKVDNKVYLFDLQAVATVPVQDKFYVQALAGGAYVHVKHDFSQSGFTAGSNSNWNFAFELGARAGYHVTQNVDVQLAYEHVFGRSKPFNSNATSGTNFYNSNYVPGLDIVTANVVYNFGDDFLG